MSRPTFRRLEYADDRDDPGGRVMTNCHAARRLREAKNDRMEREARNARLEDSSANREELMHLQGFDPVVRMTNVKQ